MLESSHWLLGARIYVFYFFNKNKTSTSLDSGVGWPEGRGWTEGR